MSTIRQMAEERRLRQQTTPPVATRANEQWGKCVGVYEVDRDRGKPRTIARVLLASGFVITAYLTAGAPAPAVDSSVLVSVGMCKDQQGQTGCLVNGGGPGEDLIAARAKVTDGGPGDPAPARATVTDGGPGPDLRPARGTVTGT